MVVETELRYLFVAVFTDGSNIVQDLNDVSVRDSKKSAYYDVLQTIEGGKQIASFGIFNDEHTWAVNLLDGHFEVDSIPFSAQPVAGHDQDGKPNYIPEGGTFRLVFTRDHQQDIITDKNGNSTLGEHRHTYRFGWEYTVAGKTYTQTIVVM